MCYAIVSVLTEMKQSVSTQKHGRDGRGDGAKRSGVMSTIRRGRSDGMRLEDWREIKQGRKMCEWEGKTEEAGK